MKIEERPELLDGTTTKIKFRCMTIYMTVNNIKDEPVETFIVAGKAGECFQTLFDALAISLSIALQEGVPASKFVEALSGVRCRESIGSVETGGKPFLSCIDEIAKVLGKPQKEQQKA